MLPAPRPELPAPAQEGVAPGPACLPRTRLREVGDVATEAAAAGLLPSTPPPKLSGPAPQRGILAGRGPHCGSRSLGLLLSQCAKYGGEGQLVYMHVYTTGYECECAGPSGSAMCTQLFMCTWGVTVRAHLCVPASVNVWGLDCACEYTGLHPRYIWVWTDLHA